ncbi:MAG: hypothetical protein R3B13_15620 [Polyangiaceae bacterium]
MPPEFEPAPESEVPPEYGRATKAALAETALDLHSLAKVRQEFGHATEAAQRALPESGPHSPAKVLTKTEPAPESEVPPEYGHATTAALAETALDSHSPAKVLPSTRDVSC